MARMINIPKGNEFQLYVPIVIAAADGVKLATADLLNVSSVQVADKYGRVVTDFSFELSANYVVLTFANTLSVGQYSVCINGLYDTKAVAFNIRNAFSVVEWSEADSRWQMFTPLVAPTQIAIGAGVTEEEVRKVQADLADLDAQVLALSGIAGTLNEAQTTLQETFEELDNSLSASQQQTINSQQQTIKSIQARLVDGVVYSDPDEAAEETAEMCEEILNE